MSEAEDFAAAVAAGGIYWKCISCHGTGVITAEAPYAALVREYLKLPPPAPCGVEFTSIDCPVCSPGAKEDDK